MVIEKARNFFSRLFRRKKPQEQAPSAQPRQKCNDPMDLLSAMADEVDSDDLENCRRQLLRNDRIGKYSKWLCIFAGAGLGGYIANFHTTPAISFIPVIGQVYDMFFGDPLRSAIAIAIGAAAGFGVFLLIAKGIYSGGVQDERNKRKV